MQLTLLAPRRHLFAAIIIFLLTASTWARIIRVGPSQPLRTVNEGLAAATSGDEIVIDCNSDSQNVKFSGGTFSVLTIRGDNSSCASSIIINYIYLDSSPLGTLTLADLTLQAGSSGSSDYDTAIITSSLYTSYRVANLALVRCRFTALPSTWTDESYSRFNVVWLPVVSQLLSVKDCYCNDIRYIVGNTKRTSYGNYLYDDRPMQFEMTNSSLSPAMCAVDIRASARLTRLNATISSNYLNADSVAPVGKRDCHTWQGFQRVVISNNNFSLASSNASLWHTFMCIHLSGARYVITDNILSGVQWIRISADAAVVMQNNSLAPVKTKYEGEMPVVAPDTAVPNANINLRLNWWGWEDGPRLTQYNGTSRDAYAPWWLDAQFTTVAAQCASCPLSCNYRTGQCVFVPMDPLAIAAIATTTSLVALYISLLLLFPYLRFCCCRPAGF